MPDHMKVLSCLALAMALIAGCHKEAKPGGPSPYNGGGTTPENTDTSKPKDYNVTGRVVDISTGQGIGGVVVSDGRQCVATKADGHFYMTSSPTLSRFVFISTPSGYLPPVNDGIPRFYKVFPDFDSQSNAYDFGDFQLTPVANPDRFTILVSADPQPRAKSARYDKIGYHSLDICEDLYRELHDVAATITDRQVYGICLGDLVHENMSLFDNYAAGLATLGFPTYNIIGNHDNDTSAQNDDEAAVPYEQHFGPRNYSFNIGGIHFVVLDNLIMKMGTEKLNSYDQGLTDAIWTWLQADLAYIPTTATLMTFSHSPMFKTESGGERSNTANHGPDYGDLINNYAEVHAWAGHTHTSFNYVYPESHRHKRVQVHTVARSTGELWTNEYLSNGTPRGFTIVEVDHGNISWRFHPTRYQRAAWNGMSSGSWTGKPLYKWSDWTFSPTDGSAVMARGGSLDEEYQMHVYPRGAYGDDYVYVNVFLWDDKWQAPVFTPDGGSPVTMEKVTSEDRHDLATTEFKTLYKTYSTTLSQDSGYSASNTGAITTLFRVKADAVPAGGTVSVTDRFGLTYSQKVSW